MIICDVRVSLKVLDVVGIIVGPVVAMFVSHVFSTGLARHVELGRGWLLAVAVLAGLVVAAAVLAQEVILQTGQV